MRSGTTPCEQGPRLDGARSFRREALHMFRCPEDGGPLAWLPDGARRDRGVRCRTCQRTYPLGEGAILQLMPAAMHAETEREMGLRDVAASQDRASTVEDDMEIEATLAALALQKDHALLELGAGAGRFSTRLQNACRSLVCADISGRALRANASGLSPESPVLLVQSDATRSFIAPATFDRVLGTLTSNLPDKASRQASYEVAARAARPDGAFVFTTHHYGIRARLRREPKEGRYGSGIYRILLTPSEVREELTPFWTSITIRPIVVMLPLSRTLRLPLRGLDRLGRRVPGLRALGELLLVEARGPRCTGCAAP